MLSSFAASFKVNAILDKDVFHFYAYTHGKRWNHVGMFVYPFSFISECFTTMAIDDQY